MLCAKVQESRPSPTALGRGGGEGNSSNTLSRYLDGRGSRRHEQLGQSSQYVLTLAQQIALQRRKWSNVGSIRLLRGVILVTRCLLWREGSTGGNPQQAASRSTPEPT